MNRQVNLRDHKKIDEQSYTYLKDHSYWCTSKTVELSECRLRYSNWTHDEVGQKYSYSAEKEFKSFIKDIERFWEKHIEPQSESYPDNFSPEKLYYPSQKEKIKMLQCEAII